MSKGERCILTVGPEYGYGAQGAGPIPSNATLIFEMQMVGFEAPPSVSMVQWIGAVVVIAIIYYILFVPDAKDLEKNIAQHDTQEL